MRVLSKSHGWLTRASPDPEGEQLVAFVEQVRKERLMLPGGCVDSCGACVLWACPACHQSAQAGCREKPVLVSLLFTCCCPFVMGMPYRCYCGGLVPDAEQGRCRCSQQFPRAGDDFGVFYDWLSLFQKDADGQRTDEEQAAFVEALSTMGDVPLHADELPDCMLMSSLIAC